MSVNPTVPVADELFSQKRHGLIAMLPKVLTIRSSGQLDGVEVVGRKAVRGEAVGRHLQPRLS